MTDTTKPTYDALRLAFALMDRDASPEAHAAALRLRHRALTALDALGKCAVNARFLPAGDIAERRAAAESGERFDQRAEDRKPHIDGLVHWLMRPGFCHVISRRSAAAYREVVLQWALREDAIRWLAKVMGTTDKSLAATFRAVAFGHLDRLLQEALSTVAAALEPPVGKGKATARKAADKGHHQGASAAQ